MIEIPKKKYYELMVAEEILDRLKYGGVDSWECYVEAIGDDMEKFKNDLWDEIIGDSEN